jgi:hypothetical protein
MHRSRMILVLLLVVVVGVALVVFMLTPPFLRRQPQK